MIQRGIEGADTIGNYLPLFQKKLADPTSTKSRSSLKKTFDFDYTSKLKTHETIVN